MNRKGMNAMKKLIAYYGDSPVYVEGFPKDCARSCEGSVHVLPGKPVTVTNDEYKHILDKYSWMKPKLKVVAEIGEDAKKDDKEGSKERSKKSSASSSKEEKKTKPSKKDGVKSKKKKTRKRNRK